ncbi:hypothetical protein [Pseudophaeobacter sp.]|uniref:hypothetical protein n=1 Tax=Pseudophaeobacter sp. TaxID=1971739 RepID=UPI00262A0FF6|nr:hypothetical protein [Pseudophaeobacter sp.]
MFNVVSRPTFTRDVPVNVPSGDGFEEQTLKATFNALTDDEQGTFNLATPDDVKDFLRKAIVSLDDLADEEGNPVTYSPAILEDLIGRGYVRIALLATYTRAQIKAVTGN